MHILVGIFGALLVTGFLWEGFETIVLPRTVSRGWRFTKFFYRTLWRRVWRPLSQRTTDFRKSDNFLSFFGPLSLILLLICWAFALVVGFAMIQWGTAEPLNGTSDPPGFGSYFYFSGVTFLTLGYGDLTPRLWADRLFAVLEAGTGFGFLAIIIGYLPVIYGAFSRREAIISLLDARAGSPPTALELLRRHAANGAIDDMLQTLRDLERWIAELLESHLSYPVLAFYRSQHDDQSWVSALMLAMDTSALIMTGLEGVPSWQAQLTFAMGRHALVDLCLIFEVPPAQKYLSRLTPPDMERIVQALAQAGIPFENEGSAPFELAELRRSYEPYAVTLARLFSFSLPPYAPASDAADDWQRSAWDQTTHFS